MTRRPTRIVAIVLATIAVETIAASEIQLQTSTLSGVAPLAVHFDAVGTTADGVSDPFRELRYSFNFGDPDSGKWQYSRLDKNEQTGGPLAAHVYDKPGKYVATLSVGKQTVQKTITVLDADKVFSGKKTICLSMDTDMTSCPDGAHQLAKIRSWPRVKDNRRYLLHAGQDFSSLGDISMQRVHNAQFGNFGDGAKPIVESIILQSHRRKRLYPDKGPDQWISDVQVWGLNAFKIENNVTAKNILIYKNNIHGTVKNTGIYFAHGFPNRKQNEDYPKSLILPKNIFVVENTSTAGMSRHTGRGQMVWMGNEFTNTRETNQRLWQAYKTFVAHNKWGGNSHRRGKANIKLHADGLDSVNIDAIVQVGDKPKTQFLVIADNTANSTSSENIWVTISIKPQDRVQGEGLESIIMERNRHIQGKERTIAGAFTGRNIIARNEIFSGDLGQPSINHLGQSLPIDWQGPYFVDGRQVSPSNRNTYSEADSSDSTENTESSSSEKNGKNLKNREKNRQKQQRLDKKRKKKNKQKT